ncbi:hypothetical protein [Actinomadura spongiicola]|uniref:hypothetical protein n=1 Tax=Actinomadura spongiicola TaxID=2303421 RepID=UPI0011C1622B|nr:hypothetical protein [Actinomadura spongiicola]
MSEHRRAAKSLSRLRGLSVVTMLLLTGCGTGEADSPMPTVAVSAPVSPPPESQTEAIKRSYIAFVAILDRADSLPASTRRQKLGVHMTDPQLTQVLDRVEEMKRTDIATYGTVATHIQSVRIVGTGATLRDCQDSSGAGLLNVRTGKKINRGVEEETIKAYLAEGSDGRWRVTKSISYGKGC